jgi:hypothetical protein
LNKKSGERGKVGEEIWRGKERLRSEEESGGEVEE